MGEILRDAYRDRDRDRDPGDEDTTADGRHSIPCALRMSAGGATDHTYCGCPCHA